LLDYINEFYAAITGFILVFVYNLIIRGLISEEVSEERKKDWRYGWF